MPNYAQYKFVNLETGVCLYTTTATESEIADANARLEATSQTTRFILLDDIEDTPISSDSGSFT